MGDRATTFFTPHLGSAVHRVRYEIAYKAAQYLLPPYLKRYQEEYTNNCPVKLTIDNNLEIASKLELGQIDLACMKWWDNRPGFNSRLWRREELVAIAPPNHQ